MKNKLILIFVALIILTVGLGCGLVSRMKDGVAGSSENSSNSNKTLTNKAVDAAVGEERIGIPECDEVLDFFTAEMNNPDDDFVTKAVKATVLNRMKEGFKKSLEENKTDTAEMAKTCREFKTQLDKYKAEQQSKEQ